MLIVVHLIMNPLLDYRIICDAENLKSRGNEQLWMLPELNNTHMSSITIMYICSSIGRAGSVALIKRFMLEVMDACKYMSLLFIKGAMTGGHIRVIDWILYNTSLDPIQRAKIAGEIRESFYLALYNLHYDLMAMLTLCFPHIEDSEALYMRMFPNHISIVPSPDEEELVLKRLSYLVAHNCTVSLPYVPWTYAMIHGYANVLQEFTDNSWYPLPIGYMLDTIDRMLSLNKNEFIECLRGNHFNADDAIYNIVISRIQTTRTWLTTDHNDRLVY